MKSIIGLIALLSISLLSGCNQNEAASYEPNYASAPANQIKAYRFAVHPWHNPQKLSESYQPLVDYLNQQIPSIQIELESSRDYQAFEQKYLDKEPDLLLPNPWQTIQAIKSGYRVITMSGNPQDFKGLFIVRKDSSITTPSDVKNKIISYPSHTALAACVMPQRYLHDHGINVTTEVNNIYVGSHDSSILNVYLGISAVGGTWPPAWRAFQKDHPEQAKQLKVIWETPSLINNSIMARSDLPFDVEAKIRSALLSLSQSEQGKKILSGMETENFYDSNNDQYRVVSEYIERFEKDVRPVSTR